MFWCEEILCSVFSIEVILFKEITNPECYYLISKDGSDYLFHAWEKGCFVLDTGYIHGVLNNSKSDRVHLMIELHMNKTIWEMLPKKNINWYLHLLNFNLVIAPIALVKRLKKKILRVTKPLTLLP